MLASEPHQLECGQHRCERITQLVAEHGKEFVLRPAGFLSLAPRGVQCKLRALPGRDVAEQDRDVAKRWIADAKRVDVIPPVERRSFLLEGDRHPGHGYLHRPALAPS